MNLNHLFCSATQISTQSNEEILDKEGNEVERLLQEQNNPLLVASCNAPFCCHGDLKRFFLLLSMFEGLSISGNLDTSFSVYMYVCVLSYKEYHFMIECLAGIGEARYRPRFVTLC